MVKLYQLPQETWSEADCKKAARYWHKDGLGTKLHSKGYIGGTQHVRYGSYGVNIYNGGCIHDGERYDGEERLLPIVHRDYEIIRMPMWGYRIRKKGSP